MKDGKELYKNSKFSEREIKGFLQVCRDLDKGMISEAYRSKPFISIRAKFQRMSEKIEPVSVESDERSTYDFDYL